MTPTPELLALRDVCARPDSPLDRAYLAKWAVRLGLEGLLKEVENERHQPGN